MNTAVRTIRILIVASAIAASSCGLGTTADQAGQGGGDRPVSGPPEWREQKKELLRRNARVMVDLLLAAIHNYSDGGCRERIQSLFERAGSNGNIAALRILDPQGKVRVSADRAEQGKEAGTVMDDVVRGYQRIYGFEPTLYCVVEPVSAGAPCRRCHQEEGGMIGLLDYCIDITYAE